MKKSTAIISFFFLFCITHIYSISKAINFETLPEILNKKALRLIKIKKYRAALKILRKLNEFDGYQKQSIYNTAFIYFKLRELHVSLNFINRLLFIDPLNNKALILKARILVYSGRGEQVLLTCRNIKRMSNLIISLFIKNYLKSRNYRMINYYLNKYLNNNPKAVYLYFLGNSFFKNGYYNYAADIFKRAVTKGLARLKIRIVRKKLTIIYYKLAVQKKLKCDFKSAIHMFMKVIKISPIKSIYRQKAGEQIRSIKKLYSLINKKIIIF